ncbi:MAG: ABC transporter ATP-binding protein [Anaerolineae bacterium]|nr:ABC transporter ATP-binding protein [Anaerolineae bacterium]
MLSVTNLSASYGKIQALRQVNLHVEAGEFVAVIGANGAGKTTLLKTLSGLMQPQGGHVQLAGKSLNGLSAETRVGQGIALVPEHRQLFGGMSVKENLLMGSYSRYTRAQKAEIEADVERVYALFPILRERQNQLAGTLSGGQQQMVAIGRGLMARPRVLMLDEPSVGLAPLVVREIFRVVAALPAQGTTVLIVEQNARQILKLADRAYVLENGVVKLEGVASDLANNPVVQQIYLGHG